MAQAAVVFVSMGGSFGRRRFNLRAALVWDPTLRFKCPIGDAAGAAFISSGEPSRMEKKEPDFPNLTAMQAQDRQFHIERAMEMGMSREEAERHADHDLADRDENERTPPSANGTA